MNSAQSAPVKKLAAEIEDQTISGGPTGKISIRIVRPNNNSGQLPVIMYFHGDGWILANKDTHDRLVREIANGAKVAVVFVDYTSSPEANIQPPSNRHTPPRSTSPSTEIH